MSKLTSKQLKKLAEKQVKINNAAFAKMSMPRKRVQIARDVLAQLELKRLVADTGYWLSDRKVNLDGEESNFIKIKPAQKNKELQSTIKDLKECHACALGGMFMCAVERADKLKLNELECYQSYNFKEEQEIGIGTNDTFDYLRRFFSQGQLSMIENAYERGAGYISHEAYKSQSVLDSAEFASDINDNNVRMRLIMENIIVNKGTFIPEQKPVERTIWETPNYKG